MKNIFFKIILILIIIPFIAIIFQSVIVRYDYYSLLPEKINLLSIFRLIKNDMLYLLMQTFAIAIISATLTIIFSYPVSYLMIDKFNNNLIYVVLLLPILMPQFVYFFGLLNVFNKLHVNNTYIAVIISHIVVMLPYSIINISNELKIIGKKYIEAGRSMGIKDTKIFIDIVFPLMKDTIINTFSLLIIISLSQYFLTLMVGGGLIKTYPMYIFPLIQGNDRNLSSNAILIYIIINVFIYYLFVLKKGYKVNGSSNN